MENMTQNTGTDDKAAKREKGLRVFWLLMIGVFLTVIVLRVLNWVRDGGTSGDGNLYGILSPLGMIFVGLVRIGVTANRTLRAILLAVGLALALAGLVMAFVG